MYVTLHPNSNMVCWAKVGQGLWFNQSQPTTKICFNLISWYHSYQSINNPHNYKILQVGLDNHHVINESNHIVGYNMGSVGHNNMYMYLGMPCFSSEISVVALFLGCVAIVLPLCLPHWYNRASKVRYCNHLHFFWNYDVDYHGTIFVDRSYD